jgi:hypothetical protein
MRTRRSLVVTFLSAALVFALALPALAAPPAAEVKAAKGVEKFEPVEAGDSFAAKDVVWAWSRVTGADGQTVKHVWKKDGKEEWSASLKIGSNDWRTYTRRTVSAGSYEVEVQAEDGTKLGSVSFTVK